MLLRSVSIRSWLDRPKTAPCQGPRACIVLISLFMALSGQGLLEAQNRPTAAPTTLGEVQGQDKRYALLVGIDRYERDDQFAPLRYAERDVSRVQARLRDLGYETKVLTTSGEGAARPDLANVTASLDRLSRIVKVNDTLLFYFAGHGFSLSGKGSFLALANTDLDRSGETALSVESLGNLVQRICSRQTVLVFDACRNPADRAVRHRGNADAQLVKEVRRLGEKDASTAVLFACSEGEYASESDDLKQGVFSYFVVEGLREQLANPRGELAVTPLMDFIQSRVEERTMKRQRPWMKYQGARMVIANFPPKTAAQSPPDVSQGSSSVLLANLKPAQARTLIRGDAPVRGGEMKGSLSFGSRDPVVYDLNGKYRTFEATVGVDTHKGGEGRSYHFYVYGDGQPLGAPVMLTVNSRPQTLSVSVTGVDQLKLLVDSSLDTGSDVNLYPGVAWWGRALVSDEEGAAPPNTTVYLAALNLLRGEASAGIAHPVGKELSNSVTCGDDGHRRAPVFDLAGKYENFRATLCVDKQLDERFQVTFHVVGDEKELSTFGPLTSRSPPLDTGSISVRGVDQLKLYLSEEGHDAVGHPFVRSPMYSGHGWWGEARLTRSSSQAP